MALTLRANWHEMLKPIFLEMKENISKNCLPTILFRMLSIEYLRLVCHCIALGHKEMFVRLFNVCNIVVVFHLNRSSSSV